MNNAYSEILTLYKKALKEKWDADKCLKNNLIFSIYRPYWLEYTDNILSSEGFAFYDLDGDVKDELLIDCIGNEFWNLDKGYFFACYTIINDKITLALEGWERNRYILGEDGYIYYFGSSEASDDTYWKAKFNITNNNFLSPPEELYS